MTDHKINESKSLNPSQWVDRYADILYRYAMVRISDPVVCEDLVQETFLAAFKGKDNFKGESAEQTWLISILKYKVLDYFRKQYRENTKEIIDNRDIPANPDFQSDGKWRGHWTEHHIPVEWGNPETFLEQKEFWQIFSNCLKKLKANLMVVFTLYELEDVTTKEICKELDITSTNLWVMLHRSRKQLRKCLEINWISPNRKDNGI